MAAGFATSLRTNRATQILNAMDAGSAGAKIRLYNGTRPATGGTVTTLLAELTCATTSGTVTNGVFTLGAITQDSSADATGTATWARIVDSDGNFVMDVSVTATGGGGDITMGSTSLIAGVPVAAISFVITEGNA